MLACDILLPVTAIAIFINPHPDNARQHLAIFVKAKPEQKWLG